MKMRFTPDAIGAGREMKQKAKELGVNLGGRPGSAADIYQPILDRYVEDGINSYQDSLRIEWERLASKFSVEHSDGKDFEQIVNVFRDTLRKRLKLYARTTDTPPEHLSSDEKLMELLLSQAVFDFIMSLRVSARSGETYGIALRLAGLSHWLNPMEVLKLRDKYGDRVDVSVIKEAAQSYPTNPVGFIDKYLVRVAELQNVYGDRVNASVIALAALGYPTNPTGFIDKYLARVDKLKVRYGDRVDAGVIKYAAEYNPTNPTGFIDKYLARVDELKVRYGDRVDAGVIKHAAEYNPTNPTGFIDKYLASVEELQARYGDKVDASVIKHAAGYNSANPTGFIDKYLKQLTELQVEFGAIVPSSIIKDAILLRQKDPRGYIREYQRNKNKPD